jgi:hypothetical protein
MYLPGSEVDARFARQFELGMRGFRYANPGKSVFPRPYDDEQLRALSVQTLLLIGDQDRTYGPGKALDRASRLVPAIDARLIAGAGHILAMQQPGTVDAEVVAFLSGRPVPERRSDCARRLLELVPQGADACLRPRRATRRRDVELKLAHLLADHA